MDEFHFKQFSVKNERAAMKVGTDGVLLGGWTLYKNTDTRALDAGTGTGIIALIAAQRYSGLGSSCIIDAIDIDADACAEASINFNNSPWTSKLTSKKISIQDLSLVQSAVYDLIISNPPFFENSLKAPDERRTTARHTDSMSYYELIESSYNLLKEKGRLSLILPFDALPKIRGIAVNLRLKLSRITSVRTTPNKPFKRVLVEMIKSDEMIETETTELTIQSGGQFTETYIYLTKDLYLKF